MANEITMVRGDTHIIAVDVFDENGDAYEPAADDVVLFTVREWNDEGTAVIEKSSEDVDSTISIVTGGWQIVIQPEDTEDWDYIDYVYDIEVTLADGYKHTVIAYSPFILTREVTYTVAP